MDSGPVGLLALQGDFEKHRQALASLGAETVLVRRPEELAPCRALVLPGGESTTLARLLARADLTGALVEFAGRAPVLGTCAGLVLLARELSPAPGGNRGVSPLGILDCLVLRNGYGRQADSFSCDIEVASINGSSRPFRGVFIRAPRIVEVGPEVRVLARHDGEPVAVQQGRILGLAFHPELTADTRFHSLLLNLATGRAASAS